MTCPRCGHETWDNRTKKMDDPKWKNAADFTCKDKACGWKSGQPAQAVGQVPLPVPPFEQTLALGLRSPPAASPSSRDTLILELFWDSFDRVLTGIAQRKLTDWAKPETIAALTATCFIQRAKG